MPRRNYIFHAVLQPWPDQLPAWLPSRLGYLAPQCLFDEGQKAQAMELLIGSLQSAACPMAVLQAVLPAMAAMATDRAKRRVHPSRTLRC